MLKIAFAAIAIGAVLAFGFAGFRDTKTELRPVEWFDDMAHQPKYLPQHRNEIFADGRAERQPVPGTIPIGFTLPGIYDMGGGSNLGGTFTNIPDYSQTGRIGEFYGDGIPEDLAAQRDRFLARGRERYDIHCSHCHGKTGTGDGVVKSFGLMTIASLTSDLVITQPDGKIFNTITHGRSTMGAHGPTITVEDRWAIIAYVRALQKVATGKLAAPKAQMEEKK